MYSYLLEDNNKNKLYEARANIIGSYGWMIEELPLKNIHENFYAFCYLLWNGYFSVNKKYIYDKNFCFHDDYTMNERFTIFLGRGCCRHNSKLLNDILRYNENYKSSREIYIHLCNNTIIKNITSIKSEMESEDSLELPRKKENLRAANHSVVYINNNGQSFILDPTNLVECQMVNKELICYDGNYMVGKRQLKKELTKKQIIIAKQQDILEIETLKSYYLNARQICVEYKKEFDEMYNSNSSDYEFIKKYFNR